MDFILPGTELWQPVQRYKNEFLLFVKNYFLESEILMQSDTQAPWITIKEMSKKKNFSHHQNCSPNLYFIHNSTNDKLDKP